MKFGNLENSYLFSTHRYLITNTDGEKQFTKSVTNEEQLKLFEDFCKKEGIKRQESANNIGKNEYHIFEGFNILCGSKETHEKLSNHLMQNVPSKRGTIEYLIEKGLLCQ